MANTYYKLLKQDKTDYQENLLKYSERAKTSEVEAVSDDLYSFVQDFNEYTKVDKSSINSLLKCYIAQVNSVNEVIEEEKPEDKYIKTSNPNIRFDAETNKYYKLTDGIWSKAKNISAVNNDGTYVMILKSFDLVNKFRKVFSSDDELIEIQVLDSKNNVIKNKSVASKALNLKKELSEKHKYSGYIGHSNDIATLIANKLSPLRETGYYMDRHCCFYIWNEEVNSFVVVKKGVDYPLLTEFEFKNNTVVRKEYTGV